MMSELHSDGDVESSAGNTTGTDTAFKAAICTNGDIAQIAAKVESLKNWTVNRFKTGKQSVLEQLGKVERTVDADMDSRVSNLKDLHQRYRDMLQSARTYADHCLALNNSQKLLAESFYQLSLKDGELKDALSTRSEVLRSFSHNGDSLNKAMSYFVSSLETLCDKTIKDTLQTVHIYEQARLNYDVYRHELNALTLAADADQSKVPEAESKMNEAKVKYEQMKEDVRVKMALLDENRVKVMKSQLAQFETGLSQWFVENMRSLEHNSPSADAQEEDYFNKGRIGPSSFLEH